MEISPELKDVIVGAYFSAWKSEDIDYVTGLVESEKRYLNRHGVFKEDKRLDALSAELFKMTQRLAEMDGDYIRMDRP